MTQTSGFARLLAMRPLALAALLSPALAAADASPPDPTAREKLALCTDGKSHYVAIGPHERLSTQLYYGDGKKFVIVPADPSGMMSGDWFPDPRFWSRTNNSSFRGLDLRTFSHVDLDAAKKRCAVVCGERTTAYSLVEPEQARPLLAAAAFEPNPRKWFPYALARDERGTYYYVDHGGTAETEKSFRLFVGAKGALKLQKMTNVVSDSEGDIFSTKSGSLRMILGKGQSTWIQGKKSTPLLPVPVGENLHMIYNELGIYTGEHLGTPCDDV
jgi:hypothetical protein